MSREIIALILAPEEEFWLYIHDEGEEFFLTYNYWPVVPRSHLIRRSVLGVEVVIKKTIDTSDNNCVSKENSYFGTWIMLDLVYIVTLICWFYFFNDFYYKMI